MKQTYLILLRGINVGGKNKISMAELKKCLEELGYEHVSTYINSGNVILDSNKKPEVIKDHIEKELIKNFKFDSELIKILVLTRKQLQAVIDDKPKGFGDKPNTYYSDVIFLIDTEISKVMPIFDPREGVDHIWPGKGVVYSQRLGAERTKSRLSKIAASPLYKSLTIRNWNTTTKLLKILEDRDAK